MTGEILIASSSKRLSEVPDANVENFTGHIMLKQLMQNSKIFNLYSGCLIPKEE